MTAPLPKSCVVVLPTRNEADAIVAVLSEVHEGSQVLDLVGCSTQVLVIDDDSVDGTRGLALEFASAVGLDLEVHQGPGCGLGTAVLAGVRLALDRDPDVIVCLDADGQHDARDIPTLIRAHFARRSDITIGSRWTRGGRSPGTSTFRLLGSRAGNLTFRAVTGTRNVTDATTAFRVLSPRVASFLLASRAADYSGYAFFSGCIALAEGAGFAISEVPITFRPRYGGVSKLTAREVRRFFGSLSRMRANRREVPSGWSGDYLAGEELELLAKASNWQSLLLESVTDHLTAGEAQLILEVGAGRGTVTAGLADRLAGATIVAVEPDSANFVHLRRVVEQLPAGSDVHTVLGSLDDVPSELAADAGANLVVYINVLEHIDDDAAELRKAFRLLRPGGTLAIAVPALQGIYGTVDARSGHYRRYDATTLSAVVAEAGFLVERVHYLDAPGIVPYWYYFRFLNRASFSSGSVRMFDRVYVPMIRALHRGPLRRLPGKTVVCVGRRGTEAARTIDLGMS